jgi:putative tricarboxylic transport membrane protein
MKLADKISGAILIAFFLFMFYQSTKLDMMYRNSPGAGFFPLWLSVLALLAAAVVVVGAFRRPASLDRPVQWPKGVGLRRIGLTFVSFLLYAYLLTVLGFILSTTAYVLFMSRMLGSRRWLSSIAVSGLTSLGLYLVFKVWLQTELPTGLLRVP